jgi:hypothetical protein
MRFDSRGAHVGESIEALETRVRHLEREVRKLWSKVLRIEEREFVDVQSFQVLENPMVAQVPGNTIVVTFTPVPADATLTEPPTIVSSDTVNAPVSVDPTGLIATVTFPPTAVVGTNFTLSISYTNPDGTVANGSFSGIIVAPVIDATSFTAAQTT